MFTFSSIKAYHIALRNGQTTTVEAVLHYIKQIKANAHLNAWLQVYEDEALQEAVLLDEMLVAGKLKGSMHGVIVGLKDVIAYKGHSLSAASKILDNYTSVYNATATERLLQQGAIIIGRQNCDEFAMGSSNENSAFGHVKNAADISRVPGGSSGGSAVAVQSGMCMISLGSDTGGSVRQPADFCGIVGMKPSYGRISRYGLIAYASSFDQIGILANTVEDVALTLEIIAGPDDYDSTASSLPVVPYTSLSAGDEQYRVAYFKNALEHPALDPELASAFRGFIQILSAKGYHIEGIELDGLDQIVPAYYVLTTAEASSNLSRYDGIRFGYQTNSPEPDLVTFYNENRSNGFGDEVKRRILLGTFVLSSGYYDAYFAKAQKVRKILVDKNREIFTKYDAVLLPTVPTPAFKIGEKSSDPIEMFLADIYTVYANLVGIPAISLPLFTHSSGLPFGLQVLSGQFEEEMLLKISAKLMELKEETSPSAYQF